MQCRLRDRRSRLFSLGLRPCPLRTEIPPDSLNLLIMLCTVEGEISKSLPIFLWGTLFLNISIIFSRICWQTGDPRPIFAPKGLDLSWMLLLYQIIITIICWHQLFQNTSLFNQFTSLLALNCSCPNFFWNVLQVWMTGKDVYLQMTWSWPDKTWNILCSYCLQWNTSQSKFRNHYFLFLFAFSILSQLFLIWGCTIYLIIYFYILLKFYFDPYSRSFFFFFHNIWGRGHNNTILIRAPIWPAAALLKGVTPQKLKEAAVKAWKSITKEECKSWWCQWVTGLKQLLKAKDLQLNIKSFSL